MKVIAYVYINPLLESPLDHHFWGEEIEEIYQDIGDRKQWENLLKNCYQSPPDYLLVRSLTELGNDFNEIIKSVKYLEYLNVKIIAIDEKYNSEYFREIKDYKKRDELLNIWQEINHKSLQQNLAKGHHYNRLKMLPPPGKAPYGYLKGKDGYIINRGVAPILRAFFERFLLTSSLRDCVRYLEREFNKKIALSTAKNWLKSPIYRGDLRYKNNQIIPDTHTAIITREEGAQIDRILKSHRQFKPRSASANYALAGLINCQKCHHSFRVNAVNKQEYLYLTPFSCPLKPTCKSLQYQKIFNLIIHKICADFMKIKSDYIYENLTQFKNKLEEDIEKKRDIIKQIPILTKDNILDEETAEIRIYKLNSEIAQLQEKLASLPPDNLTKISSALSNPQFWYDLSPSECRFYLREFIKEIKIISYNGDIKLDYVFLHNFSFHK